MCVTYLCNLLWWLEKPVRTKFGIMKKGSFIILQRNKELNDFAANERNWNDLNWLLAHRVSFVCDLKILVPLSLKVFFVCLLFFEKTKIFFKEGNGGGGRLGNDIRLPVDILFLI